MTPTPSPCAATRVTRCLDDWSSGTCGLDEELITNVAGIATVLQDELQNSYQLVASD